MDSMNIQFTIRVAQDVDAAGIAELLRQTGLWERIKAQTPEETTAQVLRHLHLCLADNSHSIFVAVDENNDVAGYIAAHWLPYLFLAGPEGYVSELFIHPEGRGQGLGRQLLDTIKAEARQRGCVRLSLLNARQRESYMRGFYQKQGWQERDHMANFVLWLSE